MPTRETLSEVKRRISSALLDTPGISGVGLRGGSVVIYLERDDSTLRQRAHDLIEKTAPDVGVKFEVSGSFNKQR